MTGRPTVNDWRAEAWCRGMDPEMFFPERGDRLDMLRAICAECPVIEPCRDWALHHESLGFWGGTTEAERKRIRRELGIERKLPQAQGWSRQAKCGTGGGYRRHRRLGEEPCEACKDAHAAGEQGRRRRRFRSPIEEAM